MSCVLDYSSPSSLALMSMYSRISSILYRLPSAGEVLHHSTCPEILGRQSGNVWKQVCWWSPWEVQFWGELKAWDSGNQPTTRPHRHPGFKVSWSLGLYALIGRLRAQHSATAKVTNQPVLGWVMSLGLWKPTGILELKKLCGTESHLVSLSCWGLLEPANTSDRWEAWVHRSPLKVWIHSNCLWHWSW